jgi:hypothetical protein
MCKKDEDVDDIVTPEFVDAILDLLKEPKKEMTPEDRELEEEMKKALEEEEREQASGNGKVG